MATSIPRVWKDKKDTVSGSSTKIVDSLPLAKVGHLDYIINFRNDTEEKTHSIKVSANKDAADQLCETHYALLANENGYIDIDVSVIKTGTNVELQLVNNETFDVDVSLTRTILC